MAAERHECRAWYRPESDRSGLEHVERHVQWVEGKLGDWDACQKLVEGCDALVHAALEHDSRGRISGGEFTAQMAMHNIAGSLQLFEAARGAGVQRVVYISSCAVHDRILGDRQLDETHPLWPASHYGAHKAAVEAFVHSHAMGDRYPICALRPTGIYGVNHPVEKTKWYDLVAAVISDNPAECHGGGKEVHAADVARAASLLLAADAEKICGEAFNCYDMYISQHDVATMAKSIAASHSEILGESAQPKHQIDTSKLRALGMKFGGKPLLHETLRDLIGLIRVTRGAVV